MASSIQLLRSTNPRERPFAGNLLEGQPAVNLNVDEPGLFFKTTDGSMVKIGPAFISDDGLPPNSNPTGQAGNSRGEIWVDASADPAVFKVYDGTDWVSVTGLSIPDGSITSDKLATDSVIASKIENGAVTGDKIAVAAIVEAKIADGAVTQDKLDPGVTTDPNDGSVYDISVASDAEINSEKLSYTSPIVPSGATPAVRTVRNKLSDIVSVLDFGADPTGVEDSTDAIQNAIRTGKHAFVPAGTYRVDGTITFGNKQSMELGQRASIGRLAEYSSNTDPVIWVRGNSIAIYGSGMSNCGFFSQNRAPYGVFRIGFANMKYNPVPQPNVTYNSFHGFSVSGAKANGQTTLDPDTGQPDSCIFICNPQFFGRAVYFQNMYDIRMSGSNIGLWLCGWANGNTMTNLHGVRLGNTATSPYNCFIYDNGGLDNAISNVFFHKSSGSTGLRVEKYDNTAEGGNVHSNYASSYRGMVFEQGGPAKGVIALNSTRSFYEVRHNVSQGNTFSSDFFDRNFWFGLGSNNGFLAPTYSQSRRQGLDTSTENTQVNLEHYTSLPPMTENTKYVLGRFTTVNNQNGALVEIKYANGAAGGINYQGGGHIVFVIKRNAAQVVSATMLTSRWSSGVIPCEPIVDGSVILFVFRVSNNGTGTSSFNMFASVKMTGSIGTLDLNDTLEVYSGATVDLPNNL